MTLNDLQHHSSIALTRTDILQEHLQWAGSIHKCPLHDFSSFCCIFAKLLKYDNKHIIQVRFDSYPKIGCDQSHMMLLHEASLCDAQCMM